MSRRNAAAVIVALLALLFVIVMSLSSCYTPSKAKAQFSRAAVAYPELPADYCSRTYPPHDSLIRGRDSLIVDTLWGDGETIFDTTYSIRRDTIYITKLLPGKTIINNRYRVDTVRYENTAALDLCAIEIGNAIKIATDKTKEADKWKAIAKKRFWIILGMGAGIALGLLLFIRRKVRKIV